MREGVRHGETRGDDRCGAARARRSPPRGSGCPLRQAPRRRPAAAALPGAHTLAPPGSHLYPETGNGGYTSLHTLVHLVYDATANRFLRGNRVVLTDRATKCLTSFSLDFERRSANTAAGPDMHVALGHRERRSRPVRASSSRPIRATPTGRAIRTRSRTRRRRANPSAARATNPCRRPARRSCSRRAQRADSLDGTPCPANKLVIDAAEADRGRLQFTVVVAYTGRPGVHNDGDGTTEGWFRAARRRLRDHRARRHGGLDAAERLPGRQADLRLLRHGHRRPDGGRKRRARLGAAPRAEPRVPGRLGHLELAFARAHRELPRRGQHRQLHAHRAHRRRHPLLRGAGRVDRRRPAAAEPQDHAHAARHHPLREPLHRAVPLHLRGDRDRHPAGELRGGDADDDRLLRRADRHRHALPREHAPVVGRQRLARTATA